MSSSEEPGTEGTSPDHSRSGDDVADAIRVAERGSSVEEVHDRGTENSPGHAPVEQRHGDPEMTEGQVVLGEGEVEPGGHRSTGPDRRSGSSGAAQSVPGARPIDQT